jgi:hypothetical protein
VSGKRRTDVSADDMYAVLVEAYDVWAVESSGILE